MDEAAADALFDILRGAAALTGSDLVARMGRAVAEHRRDDLAIAFNHKQIASKLWLKESLHETWGGRFPSVMILGGWYGMLAAILFDDPRFDIDRIDSVDIDPACAPVATTLNRPQADERRFAACTDDMNAMDYAAMPDLLVNTSCEHLADVAGWLDRIPPGQRLLLQSNDYVREPDHASCVPDLEAFKAQTRLSHVDFSGSLKMKNYTRFMLIGRR